MPKRLAALLIAFIALAVLTGCANMPSGEPSAELSDRKNGVVGAVISFSKWTRTMDAWFYVRKKGEPDKDKYVRLSAKAPLSGAAMVAFSPLLSSLAQPDFPDMPNRSGRAMAVSLPPGEYELYSWTLYIQTFGGYGYISPRQPPQPLSFVVTAGRVTYLGSLHAETVMGKNLLGLEVPGGGAIDISDQFERDSALFSAKFPNLSDWPVDRAQLDGKAWALR